MFKKFVSYYGNHKKVFYLDMISAFLMSAMDLLFPIAVRMILDDFIPDQNLKMIIYFGLGLLVVYLIRARLSFYVTYNGHIMGAYIQRDMRKDLFKKYEELDYEFYDDFQTGVLMSYITNHLRDISEMAHHVPEDLFISGIMFIGAFIYLSTINFLLTVIIFSFVVVIVVFSWWRRKKLLEAQRGVRKVHGELNSKIENSLSGIRLTKAYNNEDFEIGRFQDVNESYAESTREAYFQMGIFHVGNEFFLKMLSLLLVVVGGIFVYFKYITAIDLFTYYMYITFLTRPINRLISMMQQIQQGMAGFERFYQVMQIEPKIRSDKNAKLLTNPKGRIIFDHVNFAYNNGELQVLKNFSIDIKPGEKIGLIGETGVGKSTISKLIPRFYDVNSGSIKIDGVNVKDYDVYSLRRAIGHVQQDVFIFYGTIKDNILYGNPDASDDEIISAAKRSNIHEFIMSLPDNYMTYTGEKGVKLSGGQKQRIAIARLFLKKPKIVVLDEATSALDNVTERLIQSAFDDLVKEKTAIVIAHRLSTIVNSDRIIVLGKEGIKEMGNHQELMELKGIYYNLLQE
ncbi:ABC transporter ATP-binding protein [Candidatus Izemoplasma sp. B36]|uniref:ABC transporter ATP-binding protein n=1 Tax=Candidatus Izemoplasma sp. B36 TaxID=3242468 RepID=UPI003556CA0B